MATAVAASRSTVRVSQIVRWWTVSPSLSRLRATLPAVPPLGLYLALALPSLGLPGLYYDEAADALPAMQLLLGHPVETVRGHGISLFGATFPLMAFDYVGAVHSYAALPFLALFGFTAQALRLMTVAGGALTVLATFGWTSRVTGSAWAGCAAGVLLAAHPSFLYYTRQGVHVSSLVALWAVLALWSLAQAGGGRGAAWMAACGFFLGLGITSKVLFLWLAVAVAAAAFLTAVARRLGHPALSRTFPPVGRRTAVAAALGFTIGAAPALLYNLQTGGTLAALAVSARISQHGIDNTRYLENLATRLDSLRLLLDGSHFWFLGGSYGTYANELVVACAAVAVAAACLREGGTGPAAYGLLLLTIAGLVILQSPVTLSAIYPTHLFLLLPLWAAVVAIGLATAADRLRHWRLALVAVVLGVSAANIQVDTQYLAALRATGGLAGHSDAVGELAAYLDTRGAAQPVALDWGIRTSVQYLTGDRVRPLEIFGYAPAPDPGFEARARAALNVPDTLFLARVPELTVYDRVPAFEAVARAADRTLRPLATFRQRDGKPVYVVYTAAGPR